MKTLFLTEGNWQGKVTRDNPNMRTEMAWMCSLNADHLPLRATQQNIEADYDLVIAIIPKKNIDFFSSWDIPSAMKKLGKKVAVMQEGPHWYFQDYPLAHQIWYYNFLMEMDVVFCHNENDIKYYSGLVQKPCLWMPSLMITDNIQPSSEKQNKVMIGGNMCSWYSGFDSYITAQHFNCPISIPSMGRKISGEEELENLNHLPYMQWIDWIAALSEHKYGIHLMRTHAAGTFALNCAYAGIPCIGYKGLDTQTMCHEELSVETGDIMSAVKLTEKLKSDTKFYEDVSIKCKENYKEAFSEEMFLRRFEEYKNIIGL